MVGGWGVRGGFLSVALCPQALRQPPSQYPSTTARCTDFASAVISGLRTTLGKSKEAWVAPILLTGCATLPPCSGWWRTQLDSSCQRHWYLWYGQRNPTSHSLSANYTYFALQDAVHICEPRRCSAPITQGAARGLHQLLERHIRLICAPCPLFWHFNAMTAAQGGRPKRRQLWWALLGGALLAVRFWGFHDNTVATIQSSMRAGSRTPQGGGAGSAATSTVPPPLLPPDAAAATAAAGTSAAAQAAPAQSPSLGVYTVNMLQVR